MDAFFQLEAEKAEISAFAGFLARGCFFSLRPYIGRYKNILAYIYIAKHEGKSLYTAKRFKTRRKSVVAKNTTRCKPTPCRNEFGGAQNTV